MTKKKCPLRNNEENQSCREEDCAWWNRYNCECAVWAIAVSLRHIYEHGAGGE